MEIRILGIGGFENVGLPFNSFLIDGHVLVETPPDILQSLHRENIGLEDIDTIVITHFHGDHCFGLPFLFFNIYARRFSIGQKNLVIAGPAGLKETVKTLLGLAISPDHPYVEWCLSSLHFAEIDETAIIQASGDLWLRFFRTEHSVPTYSVMAGKGSAESGPLFIATSDTRWSPRLRELFALKPRLMLCDSNGEGFGGVHMSPDEIQAHIVPFISPETRLVGTHVSREMPRERGGMVFARCGDVFEI